MLPALPEKGQTLLIVICLLLANVALADAYSDARSELVAAYETQNFAAMQDAANKALAARPGYPGALFNLAFAKALAGDNVGSLETLGGLVATGVDYGVADIEEFAALKGLPNWQIYEDSVAALHDPTATTLRLPRYSLSCCSKAAVCGPSVSHPDRSVRATLSTSLSSIDGRKNGRNSSRMGLPPAIAGTLFLRIVMLS